MLHAIYHNKGNLWKRYLGHRDELERNVFAEDEITSAFLGTQNFLNPKDVWQIWQTIVGADLSPQNVTSPPEFVDIQLWPRREIEPDALISFNWSNGIKGYLLIEFKWDAGESGENQLEKQWSKFLNKDERENAWHLYISKDISAAVPHLNQWRIRPITWLQVRSALKKVRDSEKIMQEGTLLKYCDLMDRFMEKIQIFPFNGFCNLPESQGFLEPEGDFVFFKFNKH